MELLAPGHHAEVTLARSFGFSLEGWHRLQSLVAERGNNSWAVGDLLVAVFDAPPPPGVLDGSREKLGRVADELGCSVSWLTATRITAAAWPRRHRRGTVSWVVHRKLSAHPGRVILLDHFADDCRREGVTPTGPKLRAWLDANSPKASKLRSVGRPRLDPVARVEKLALQLDRDQLARLVERLAAALGEVAAA